MPGTGTNKTESQLNTQANEIYDETTSGANTAVRIGQKFLDLIKTLFTRANPDGGLAQQVLKKNSGTDHDYDWADTNELPAGGVTGQAVRKTTNFDHDYGWADIDEVPDGGTTGQVLKKNSNTDQDIGWADDTDTNTQLSDSQVETAYNNQVSTVSQAEAEAGTSTTIRTWTAQRVAQAIAALETGGGGSSRSLVETVDLNSSQTLDMDYVNTDVTTALTASREITTISNASAANSYKIINIDDPNGFAVTFASGLGVVSYGTANTSSAYSIILYYQTTAPSYVAIFTNSQVAASSVTTSGHTGVLTGDTTVQAALDTVDGLKQPDLGKAITEENLTATYTLDLDSLTGHIARLDMAGLSSNPSFTLSNGTIGGEYLVGIKQNANTLDLTVAGTIYGYSSITTTDNEVSWYRVVRLATSEWLMTKTADATAASGSLTKEVLLSFASAGSAVPTRTDSKVWQETTTKNVSQSLDLTLVDGTTDSTWNLVNNSGFSNGGDGYDNNITDVDSKFNELLGHDYFRSGASNPLASTTVGFNLEGLSSSSYYSIDFWFSSDTTDTPNPNRIEVRCTDDNGNTDQELANSYQNSTTKITYENLRPRTGTDDILIRFEASDTSNELILCTMEIREYDGAI